MDEKLYTLKDEREILLDNQLNNLSERIFEVGKKIDQQLTAWLLFVSLTILLGFGVSDTISIGGLQLEGAIATTITFILSCAYYYRIQLSNVALEAWRNAFKERRKLRLPILAQLAKEMGEEQEISGFISEYPGYLAASALVKTEARQVGGFTGIFVTSVHNLVIILFTLSPYILAIALIYRSQSSVYRFQLSGVYNIIVALGLMVCFSANFIGSFQRKGFQATTDTPTTGNTETEMEEKTDIDA